MKYMLLSLVFLSAAGVSPAEEPQQQESSFPILDWLISWLGETDSQFYGYAEAGKRSSLEDWEDESADGDYSYTKLNLKFTQAPFDRLTYSISAFRNTRDYDTLDNLDNTAKVFKAGADYDLWKEGDRSLELDIDFLLGNKEFENTPADDYTRFKAVPAVSYRVQELYTLKLAAGIDNYDYPDAAAKNRFKQFFRAEGWRYLKENKLRLSGSFTVSDIRQDLPGIKRIQRDVRAGADWKFDLPAIYKIVFRIGAGSRDTLEDPEIDGQYDYDYTYAYIKTAHRISEKTDMNLKCQVFSKDYAAALFDHTGCFLQNGWGIDILGRKEFKVKLDIDAEHKQVEYDLVPLDSYRKSLAQIKCSVQKIKNWKVSAGLQANMYDYDDPAKDKTRTYIVLSGEKILKQGDVRLSMDWKYRYTDYDSRSDESRSSVRIGGLLKF